MTERAKVYRYILRFETRWLTAEPALVRLARILPGAQLSRNEYEDHGDHLMKTGRTQLVAAKR